ncbi:MAG: Gfo/Idh/MocA family oxidoreductase [Nitrososphaerota archaeon]
MVSRVRIGFAGVAHFHADSYAQCLKTIPQAEVVGVYEMDRGLASQFSEKFGMRIYGSIQEMLREVDAVVITSENVLHYNYAVEAAEGGRHILCEKPMTVGLEQADNLVRLVQRKGIKFQMCYVMRYHTVTSLAKELVAHGSIGELLAMTGTNKLNRSLPLLRKWFTDGSLSGGGAVMDHTVHLSDLMRWYAGSEIVEVYTEIGRNVNSGISVEDNFLTTIRMSNRVLGNIDGSWTYSSGHYTWGDVTLELLGTLGIIQIDAFRQNVSFIGSEKPDDRLSWHYYGCNPDMLMVRDFLRCILEDAQPLAGVYDGRQGVSVTLASYESSKLGRAVAPS